MGLCVNSLPSSPIGDTHLGKTTKTFSRAPSTIPTRKQAVCKGAAALPSPGTNVILEYCERTLCVPSPREFTLQAELGFSLGLQASVCSQLPTSNTGHREDNPSRRERNIMGKANTLHLLWVTGSGFHFLVYR